MISVYAFLLALFHSLQLPPHSGEGGLFLPAVDAPSRQVAEWRSELEKTGSRDAAWALFYEDARDPETIAILIERASRPGDLQADAAVILGHWGYEELRAGLSPPLPVARKDVEAGWVLNPRGRPAFAGDQIEEVLPLLGDEDLAAVAIALVKRRRATYAVVRELLRRLFDEQDGQWDRQDVTPQVRAGVSVVARPKTLRFAWRDVQAVAGSGALEAILNLLATEPSEDGFALFALQACERVPVTEALLVRLLRFCARDARLSEAALRLALRAGSVRFPGAHRHVHEPRSMEPISSPVIEYACVQLAETAIDRKREEWSLTLVDRLGSLALRSDKVRAIVRSSFVEVASTGEDDVGHRCIFWIAHWGDGKEVEGGIKALVRAFRIEEEFWFPCFEFDAPTYLTDALESAVDKTEMILPMKVGGHFDVRDSRVARLLVDSLGLGLGLGSSATWGWESLYLQGFRGVLPPEAGDATAVHAAKLGIAIATRQEEGLEVAELESELVAVVRGAERGDPGRTFALRVLADQASANRFAEVGLELLSGPTSLASAELDVVVGALSSMELTPRQQAFVTHVLVRDKEAWLPDTCATSLGRSSIELVPRMREEAREGDLHRLAQIFEITRPTRADLAQLELAILDGQVWQRLEAVQIAARLGPRAAEIDEALSHALADSDESVRAAARGAFRD